MPCSISSTHWPYALFFSSSCFLYMAGRVLEWLLGLLGRSKKAFQASIPISSCAYIESSPLVNAKYQSLSKLILPSTIIILLYSLHLTVHCVVMPPLGILFKLVNFSHKNCLFFDTDNTGCSHIYNHLKVPKVLTFQISVSSVRW